MTTEQKTEAIKEAIEKAKNHQSKMDEIAWSVPALSSLKIRHLMSNLGAISTRYLECGVHKGGLFCSTVRNNPNLKVTFAIDNWASDEGGCDMAYPQFVENAQKCKSRETVFGIKKGDSFDDLPEPPTAFPNDIDLYLYDAAHDYESQRKAMTHFLPVMADEFIVCVDDFDWDDVRGGTMNGFSETRESYTCVFEQVFKGNNHDNDGWWNGFYIALLKKK